MHGSLTVLWFPPLDLRGRKGENMALKWLLAVWLISCSVLYNGRVLKLPSGNTRIEERKQNYVSGGQSESRAVRERERERERDEPITNHCMSNGTPMMLRRMLLKMCFLNQLRSCLLCIKTRQISIDTRSLRREMKPTSICGGVMEHSLIICSIERYCIVGFILKRKIHLVNFIFVIQVSRSIRPPCLEPSPVTMLPSVCVCVCLLTELPRFALSTCSVHSN